ncbi:hypothetical protein AB0K05_27190 [Nonomuraea sp. NPDC049486]|uniref:hypothetical protein n=1 Tax=Nonomuraea sp. NPDC049486 TaxID=3155773 RepID=UPI0034419430
MTYRLTPIGPAVDGGPVPETVLTWDGPTLVATACDDAVRVRPAMLYRYRYDRQQAGGDGQRVTGLAALDHDGLVLLDLPGAWPEEQVTGFAAQAGVPVDGCRFESSKRVRARLSGRAPGWRRVLGVPPPKPARWRLPLIYAAGAVGLAVMVYLVSVGAWAAWRGLSVVGRVLIDLVEVKWLVVAFSPLLLVLRPIKARWRRYEASKGMRAGPLDGPNLVIGASKELVIHNSGEQLAPLEIGRAPGRAAGLLAYQYEDRSGLFILNHAGRPLHHIPGPWSPEDLRRLAARNDLDLSVLRLSREEYVDLVRTCGHGSP